MGKLETLPVEVLAKIFEHLTIDTTDYEYPNTLDILFLRAVQIREPYLHQVLRVHFEPLMYVNRFFYDLVGTIIFRNLVFMTDQFSEKSFLTDDVGPFVFDIQTAFKQSALLPKCYYEVNSLHERALPIVKNLWICDYKFDYASLLGARWLEGVVDIGAMNLTSLLIDMSVLEGIYDDDEETGQCFEWQKYTEANSPNILAPFIIEHLSDPVVENKSNVYKLQLLLSTFAKLVSAQKPGFTCKVVSQSNNLLYLASLLWIFNKQRVLDTVDTLEVIYDEIDPFTKHFPLQLKKMKKLKNLSFTSDYEQELTDEDLGNIFSAVACLDSLEQMIIEVLQPPVAPTLPSKLCRISANNNFLFGRQTGPFGSYLDNVVELCLDFQLVLTGTFNQSETTDDMFKMKNLATLKIEGYIMENKEFLSTLLQSNPDITSLSVSLSAQQCHLLLAMLRGLEKIECLSFNCVHPDPPLSTDSGFMFTPLVSIILAGLLPSLRVLLVSAFPSKISLKQLIQDLARIHVHKTHNLTKIYIYGHKDHDTDPLKALLPEAASELLESESTEENESPLTLLFTETAAEIVAMFKHDFGRPDVALEEFVNFKYMSPKNNGIPCYHNLRIDIDVSTVKRLFGKTVQSKVGSTTEKAEK
jgi:hypothetical protein